MTENETVWTIVVAAGSGLRFGSAKQFEIIGGTQIVDWATKEAKKHSVGVILFEAVVRAAGASGIDAAIPGIAVADTVKVVDDQGRVVSTPDRATLRAVQTPQAFRASVLRAAHASAPEATDDAAVVEAHGGYVVVVEGEADNRKITGPDDLVWAEGRCIQ